MAEGTFNLDSGGVEVSKIRSIADTRRAELDAKNRYRFSKQYDKSNNDVYSEGIGGDNSQLSACQLPPQSPDCPSFGEVRAVMSLSCR